MVLQNVTVVKMSNGKMSVTVTTNNLVSNKAKIRQIYFYHMFFLETTKFSKLKCRLPFTTAEGKESFAKNSFALARMRYVEMQHV